MIRYKPENRRLLNRRYKSLPDGRLVRFPTRGLVLLHRRRRISHLVDATTDDDDVATIFLMTLCGVLYC